MALVARSASETSRRVGLRPCCWIRIRRSIAADHAGRSSAHARCPRLDDQAVLGADAPVEVEPDLVEDRQGAMRDGH
jgi:hypothetical protein